MSSRSICCCLLNFRNARRFSTRSLSLANSLLIKQGLCARRFSGNRSAAATAIGLCALSAYSRHDMPQFYRKVVCCCVQSWSMCENMRNRSRNEPRNHGCNYFEIVFSLQDESNKCRFDVLIFCLGQECYILTQKAPPVQG